MNNLVQEYFQSLSSFDDQELEELGAELQDTIAHMTFVDNLDVLLAQKEAIDLLLKERHGGAQ